MYKLAFYRYRDQAILYPKDASDEDMNIYGSLPRNYRNKEHTNPYKVVNNIYISDKLFDLISKKKRPRGLYFIHKHWNNIVSPLFSSRKETKAYANENEIDFDEGYHIRTFDLWY